VPGDGSLEGHGADGGRETDVAQSQASPEQVHCVLPLSYSHVAEVHDEVHVPPGSGADAGHAHASPASEVPVEELPPQIIPLPEQKHCVFP
jgi:hypothetical protein